MQDEDKPTRVAVIRGKADRIEEIQRYMPANYEAEAYRGDVYIRGVDNAGWTLDGYVIPRLMSGVIVAKELTTDA